MTNIPILQDFPQCESCGWFINRPGLCPFCAALKQSVDHVTEVSERVEIPLECMIGWEDLLDRP